MHGGAPRLGVRLLRELHRGLPERGAHVQERARHEAGGHMGRDAAVGDRDGLPLLRRRLHARAACAGQLDRQGHLTSRPQRDLGSPMCEGTVRIPVRAAARTALAQTADRTTIVRLMWSWSTGSQGTDGLTLISTLVPGASSSSCRRAAPTRMPRIRAAGSPAVAFGTITPVPVPLMAM